MKENHHEVVRKQFCRQAPRFRDKGLALSDPGHLEWMVSNLPLEPHLVVLDVAAGTGHLGRAIAPHVKRVVALDTTEAMLAEGRREAGRDGIGNIVFEHGLAEDLPFLDGAFDMVVSRFAIHHFVDPHIPLSEMVRVCRPGGTVAVIDLVSPEDEVLAVSYNRFERMRDASHTQVLTAGELQRRVQEAGLDIIHAVSREVDVNVDRWLELTGTTPETKRAIIDALTEELHGSQQTGMRPFLRGPELMFQQTWIIVVGARSGVGSEQC